MDLFTDKLENCTGFPVGNFGIAGEISPHGDVFRRVLYNPPLLGSWLDELGRGQMEITCDFAKVTDCDFEVKKIHRLYPEAGAQFSDSRFDGLRINADFFAPIKTHDAFVCSIPVLCMELEFFNSSSQSRSVSASFNFVHQYEIFEVSLVNSGGFWLVGGNRVKIGFDHAITWRGIDDGICVSASVDVAPNSSRKLKFMLLCYDPNGYYSNECGSFASLAGYVSENWEQFKKDRNNFINLLPKTHDEQINRCLRWYLTSGIQLTRLTKDYALTMGYSELNQRDSFWTSWLHLVLWPELEQKMIEESAIFQRPDGKIPTTILPIIDREDDIDINEYFNLRIIRYYEWTHDLHFAKKMWPYFKLSVEYLKQRDTDGDGYLDQGSYWGDWKDVKGVLGRKASPHFMFLWLAVLKEGSRLARALDDEEAAQEYSDIYERCYGIVNDSISSGGMWNISYYTSKWYDGRRDDHMQEDQFAGPLYGVIPESRIRQIFTSLEANLAQWGIRDTFPYRENFSHVGGDYHNGGIWPFLNFADALTRLKTGYPERAFEILRRVGQWDLEKWGDYMPAEYLDGNTGENKGKPIQAWNADYFAAVYFGALGVKMLSEGKVEIMPKIPAGKAFDTPIVLPSGIIYISQKPIADGTSVIIKSEIPHKLEIHYGVMISHPADNSKTETIGECEYITADITIAPKECRELLF